MHISSELLWRWTMGEVLRLRRHGREDLLIPFGLLETQTGQSRAEDYLTGLDRLHEVCQETSEKRFGWVVRYLMGRTQAFALDQPSRALQHLIGLHAELGETELRGGPLQKGIELELYRAYHKIDAPGFRTSIAQGLRDLWQFYEKDLGPHVETLDIWWRTAFWCGDAEMMEEGLSLPSSDKELQHSSWTYWSACLALLQGRPEQAIEALQRLLDDAQQRPRQELVWTLYSDVLLLRAHVQNRNRKAAQQGLSRLESRACHETDPMLHWELARARAELQQLLENWTEEAAAWARGVEVVEGLGMTRLTLEYALNWGAAANRADDRDSHRDAGNVVARHWERLRSRGDLESQRAEVFP